MDSVLPSLNFRIETFVAKAATVQETECLVGASLSTYVPAAIPHEVLSGDNSVC